MKKISCNIIKDILPLYVDEVVSDDTKEMVEEHLKSCDACREEAMLLKKDIVLPLKSAIQKSEANILKNLKKQFRNKKIIVSFVSILAAIAISFGCYAMLVLPKKIIPYDSSMIKIEEINGRIYARYKDKNLAGSAAWVPFTTKINGEEKQVAAFYLYSTPWSNITAKYQDDADMKPDENLVYIGKADDIEQIYYGDCDVNSTEDFYTVIDTSELVWEK